MKLDEKPEFPLVYGVIRHKLRNICLPVFWDHPILGEKYMMYWHPRKDCPWVFCWNRENQEFLASESRPSRDDVNLVLELTEENKMEKLQTAQLKLPVFWNDKIHGDVCMDFCQGMPYMYQITAGQKVMLGRPTTTDIANAIQRGHKGNVIGKGKEIRLSVIIRRPELVEKFVLLDEFTKNTLAEGTIPVVEVYLEKFFEGQIQKLEDGVPQKNVSKSEESKDIIVEE